MTAHASVALRELLVALESGSRPKGGVKGIEAGVPSLGGEHLDWNGGFRFDRIRFVPPEFAAAMRRGQIQVGDILVVKDGATTGKVSLVRDSFPYLNAVVNEHVFLCRCGDSVDPRYAFWYLFSANGQKQILSDFRGAAQGGISQRFADLVEIPLRPISEQRDIVAEIEKQFSRLDEAVANLKRVKANLKGYKAAVLKAAVEGRLVPTEAELARGEGRSYETGAELLSHILGERRRHWPRKSKYKDSVASLGTSLTNLPAGWTWATADQVCSQITDGEHIQPRYQPAGYPMLTAKHVRDGYVSFEGAEFIAEEDFRICLKRCAPAEGDILIVSVGATTGRTAVVGPSDPFALVRSVLLLKPTIPSRFLLTVLQAPGCQTYIRRASGSTAQAHLYIKDTRLIPVPLPPLSEQIRIVTEVERRLSIIREVDAEVDANLKRAAALRNAVLADKFGGSRRRFETYPVATSLSRVPA